MALASGKADNTALDALAARVRLLESTVFNDITANAFALPLNTLDGIIVTGVAKPAENKLEC